MTTSEKIQKKPNPKPIFFKGAPPPSLSSGFSARTRAATFIFRGRRSKPGIPPGGFDFVLPGSRPSLLFKKNRAKHSPEPLFLIFSSPHTLAGYHALLPFQTLPSPLESLAHRAFSSKTKPIPFSQPLPSLSCTQIGLSINAGLHQATQQNNPISPQSAGLSLFLHRQPSQAATTDRGEDRSASTTSTEASHRLRLLPPDQPEHSGAHRLGSVRHLPQPPAHRPPFSPARTAAGTFPSLGRSSSSKHHNSRSSSASTLPATSPISTAGDSSKDN